MSVQRCKSENNFGEPLCFVRLTGASVIRRSEASAATREEVMRISGRLRIEKERERRGCWLAVTAVGGGGDGEEVCAENRRLLKRVKEQREKRRRGILKDKKRQCNTIRRSPGMSGGANGIEICG